MKPVRIGLIGVGRYVKSVHLPALALIPDLQLVAVATSNKKSAAAAGKHCRVDAYDDFSKLLARDDIEGVMVATSIAAFPPICRAVLEAGKHLYLETPGITDVPTARKLMALAGKKRLVAQVGFLTRYSAAFNVLKSHLDRQPPPRLFFYEYFPWLAHTFNLALYLSGSSVARVIAATTDATGTTTTLRFKNGDTAVVIGRLISNCSLDIEQVRVSTPNFYGAVEGRRRVYVVDQMKKVDVDAWSTGSARGTTYDPQIFANRFLESSGAVPMLRDFVRAIRKGIPPRSTFADAIETQELLRAIAKAAGGK